MDNISIKERGLRDKFAGQAMQVLLEGYRVPEQYFNSVAERSYKMADAMIKARRSTNKTNTYG